MDHDLGSISNAEKYEKWILMIKNTIFRSVYLERINILKSRNILKKNCIRCYCLNDPQFSMLN